MTALLALFGASAIGAKLEKIALYALAVFVFGTACYLAGVMHEKNSTEVLQLKTEIATLNQDKQIAEAAHKMESIQTDQLNQAVETNQKVIDEYRTQLAAKANSPAPAPHAAGTIGPTQCPPTDPHAGSDFLNKLHRIERN